MTIGKYLKILGKNNLFKNFVQDELLQLFKTNKYYIKKYKKDQVIHLQNEVCIFMDIILSGQVAGQKIDENGNILTISTFTANDVVGANLIFANSNHYPMTVMSKSDSIMLHIHKELILELCQKNIGFLTAFITVISNKSVILADKINSISMKTIRECIIDFLTYEYHIQKSNVIKLNMSKKEIAERFGIQRPSLSRELNKMRSEGLLEYDAKTITIKNMDIIV